MTRGIWKGPFVHPSLLKKIDKLYQIVVTVCFLESVVYSNFIISYCKILTNSL